MELYIFLWWLSGFLICAIGKRLFDGYITGGDLLLSMLFGVAGPISLISVAAALIYQHGQCPGWWDKKIF